MAEPAVMVSFEGARADIRLNRPAVRNALNDAMFDALDAAVAQIAADEDVTTAVFSGQGPAFCSGFDLSEASRSPGVLASFLKRLSTVCSAIRSMPQVTIASIEGAALAGGCALAAASDYVVASEDAQFGYPVHRIGLSPAVNIPMVAGRCQGGAARSLLLGGEIITAREALRIGLVTQVSTGGTAAEVDALCARLQEKGRAALRATKQWLNRLDGTADSDRLALALSGSLSLAGGEEERRLLGEFLASRARGGKP